MFFFSTIITIKSNQMSSLIPLDVVVLCIRFIIFNVFKKKKILKRSKRQQAVRIVITITRVTTYHAYFFSLHIIYIRKYDITYYYYYYYYYTHYYNYVVQL